MNEQPDVITICNLEVVLMPNGEVLCLGRTVGWFRLLARFLTEKAEARMSDPARSPEAPNVDMGTRLLRDRDCGDLVRDQEGPVAQRLAALSTALAGLVTQWRKPRRTPAQPVTPYPKTYQDGVEETRRACAAHLAALLVDPVPPPEGETMIDLLLSGDFPFYPCYVLRVPPHGGVFPRAVRRFVRHIAGGNVAWTLDHTSIDWETTTHPRYIYNAGTEAFDPVPPTKDGTP